MDIFFKCYIVFCILFVQSVFLYFRLREHNIKTRKQFVLELFIVGYVLIAIPYIKEMVIDSYNSIKELK